MTRNNTYIFYKSMKMLIEKAKLCSEQDHGDNPLLEEAKAAIKSIDDINLRYFNEYEREKAIILSFTPEQIDHICYQIGDWYLMMKPLLEGQHNLGHMKEKLKMMICGE